MLFWRAGGGAEGKGARAVGAGSTPLRKLWRFFLAIFVSRRRRRSIWAIEFIPTNISKVDEELGISKRAKEQGAAGFPSIMDTQPDFVHRLIFSHFLQKMGNLHTDVQEIAPHYDAEFTQLGIERIPDQVRSAPDRFQQLADSALASYWSRLDDLRARLKNAKDAYEKFKESYGGIPDADYPESKAAYYAIPFFFLAGEAAFNSYMFSGADPTGGGVAGGVKVALIIALINVVIAVMIGNGLRNVNSKNPLKKTFGWILACIAILYIPLNLFWAHYRDRAIALKNLDAFSFDELIKLRMHVLPDAWNKFIEHPLAIASIESWGMFLFGCVIVVIALTDGYKMSDPIPGYEDLHRAQRRAQTALESLRDKCLRLVESAFVRISGELLKAEKSFNGLLASYEAILATQGRLETVYKNQSLDYVESYETAIALYRAENQLHRGGAPTPAYFNQFPESLPVAPFPADLQARAERRGELRSYSERISAEVSAANAALQEKRAKALRDIGVNSTRNPNEG